MDGLYGDIKAYKNGYIALHDNGLKVFDKNFEIIKEIDIPNLDIHGLDFDKTNIDYIYIVETAHNAVGIYNLSTKNKEEEFRLSESKVDCHHINDILVRGEHIYLSMFSLRGGIRPINLYLPKDIL